MKVKLPIIGPIRTGKDAVSRTYTRTVEKPVEKLTMTQLGVGFIEHGSKIDYKTVSDRLIAAFYGWTYVNVDRLAEAVSKIEFELYSMKFVKGEAEFNQIHQHEVLDLLDRFNPFTTTTDAIYLMETFLELAGDTFLLLDKPKPTNLFILPSDKVTVIPGGPGDKYQIKRYEYDDQVEGDNVHEEYPADLVIQIKKPNPSNPYRGKSTVEAAATAIDTSNLMDEFFKMFFKNGAVPGVAFSSDSRISPDDLKRIEQQFKAKHGGVRNAFKALVLGGGLKPVPMQQSGREMQMLELEQALRDKIMVHFGNTKASLGLDDEVNRAAGETLMTSWKQHVIKPKMQRICDALNEFLIPRYGSNLILTFKDPVPENREAKLKEVTSSAGVATINERRAMLDLDPLAGEEFDTIQMIDPELLGGNDEDSE